MRDGFQSGLCGVWVMDMGGLRMAAGYTRSSPDQSARHNLWSVRPATTPDGHTGETGSFVVAAARPAKSTAAGRQQQQQE